MTVFFFLSGMALMAASILLFACLALGAVADRRRGRFVVEPKTSEELIAKTGRN